MYIACNVLWKFSNFIDISISFELQSYPLVSKFVAKMISIGFSYE